MTFPASPIADELYSGEQWLADLPKIGPDDHFVDVVRELSKFFVDEITLPYTFEQFHITSAGDKLRNLVDYMITNTKNKVIISALLTLKWHFSTLEIDDPRINETRAMACEIVAWRYLSRLSEREAVDFCLYEIPPLSDTSQSLRSSWTDVSERSQLLPRFSSRLQSRQDALLTRPTSSRRDEMEEAVHNLGVALPTPQNGHKRPKGDPTSSFIGLTSLEIAVVSDSKKFLGQDIIQKIITGIWRGDIMFWADLNEHTEKKPQFYTRENSDQFARLRVPKYIKIFEFVFFVVFLMLYYVVLMERDMRRICFFEILLYVWFAAFACDEFSGFMGAGTMVYSIDIWNGFDAVIILIGASFMVARAVGMLKRDDEIINTAFDILSLEALFMVPRLCSLLSLLPYFATLIPCLKAMVKDFVKFMTIVGILFVGFLTTFSLLARESFTLREMSWVLTKVFFGQSSEGFAVMHQIDPRLGPPLMIVFVCMTNILLITSLVCVLRESFSKIFANARQEYLYVYSVYVLEASTSNSLTYFYPPLNLIPLVLIGPLRLLFPAQDIRKVRILALKISHLPISYAIWALEHLPWGDYKSGEHLFSDRLPETTRILIDSVKAKENRTKNGESIFSDPQSRVPSGNITHQGPVTAVNKDFTEAGMLKEVNIKGKDCATEITLVRKREAELEEKVAALSAQITELTALIMRSQSRTQSLAGHDAGFND
ncbi:hypothetical protein BJ875DRAFT_485244 [Amylocarpus encephaloides]|uniref:Calcium channel YVC1-like C-terminal transmembrane domain-containing protein n=1 Tax=Amylocarpus encephaloides TaxID=45428 RepID=A0A9P8C5T3_9HELO|nr:hypothetical protein BJ875DRAFT_485244 [Amylocarpus encephaloides]